jgi:hypothetical protein
MKTKYLRIVALAGTLFLTACAAAPALPVPTGTPQVERAVPFATEPPGQGVLAAQPAGPAPAFINERNAQVQTSLAQNPPVLRLNGLNAEQQQAQAMTLADSRVLQYARNPQTGDALRNEVMGVYAARDSDITQATQACRANTCYRVDLYNYAYNLTTRAIVDLTARQVLAVTQLPDMQPDIPEPLVKLATQIAVNAPEVAQALGFKPGEGDALMATTKTALNGTRCERSRHLCVAPTFVQGDRALWAIVDLTENRLVGVRWTAVANAPRVTEQRLADEVISEKYCDTDTPVAREGWAFKFILTASDGLRISDVNFQDTPVLRSAKLVDWHVSYSQREGFGYSDAVGCPTFSSAAVVPFKEPTFEDITQGGQKVGFALVQEFRSPGWPLPCNYSYRQRYEFYADGRFRTAVASIGSGCGNDGMYRPVLRIDPAGDDLTFSEWAGSEWKAWETEQWQVMRPDTVFTPEGFQYRWLNANKEGYAIEPGRGQFGDGGRGDFAFMYVTRRHADRDEGESDLITIGPCCNADFQQGPEKFIDAAPEPIANAPITLWYVMQLKNDDTPGREYCWARYDLVNGVYEPVSWPCYAGPMFHAVKK